MPNFNNQIAVQIKEASAVWRREHNIPEDDKRLNSYPVVLMSRVTMEYETMLFFGAPVQSGITRRIWHCPIVLDETVPFGTIQLRDPIKKEGWNEH